MRTDEVPQEGLPYKERDRQQKLMYAVDKDGKYTGINSVGWGPENLALRQAWEEVETTLTDTVARVKAGELSPLAYYMQRNLMDVALLAKYAGRWQWTVKRHLKQKHFQKLSEAVLDAYARIFNISVEALKNPVFEAA